MLPLSMHTTPVLQTERLILHGITPKIIHDVFAIKEEEEIRDLFGLDDRGYELYQDMNAKGMATNRISLFFFLLIEKASGRPFGECGFHTWNRHHCRAELYYHIRHEEFKRKGYMTEALAATLYHGFNVLGLNRVEALVAPYNEPSLRLLKQHHFIYEGRMREDYLVGETFEPSDCFSLLRSEWNARVQGKLAESTVSYSDDIA